MRFGKFAVLGAALVMGAGCGKDDGVDDQEYVESLPDISGTALEINGDAATEEGAALVSESIASAEAALNGQGPEMLEKARAQVKELNAALKQALAPVAELVRQSADAQPGDVVVYGPQDRANATFKLAVKKLTERRYAWKLEARPLGSSDDAAYKLVASGGIVRGLAAHRGRGTLGINLDNLKAVASSFPGQGKLLVSFTHTAGDDKALSYRLVNFTPDTSAHAPVTGAFVGHKLRPSGATRVRVFGPYNLEGTATSAKETVVTSVRWLPGTGGRADMRAWGGDIAQGTFYIGSACWDGQERQVFKVLRRCTVGASQASCTEVDGTLVGTREACPAAELRGDIAPPSDDVTDETPEQGAPDTTDPLPTEVTAEF